MIKLLALDIDGTLLRSDQTISTMTIDTLHECEKKGIEWMFVSGRNYHMVKPILDEYKLSCDLILNNGHEYVDRFGKQKSCVWMKEDILRSVLEILLPYDYHISIHTDKGKYILTDKETYFADHIKISKMKRKSNLEGMENSPLFNKEKVLHNCFEVKSIDELLSCKVHVLKIDARNLHVQKVIESMPLLKQIDHIKMHSSYESFIEISDDSSDKAKMLEDVIKEKHIKKDEVCIFGDSMNDLELFQSFEHSFAMENAKSEIKKYARWLTASNDHDGVAKAIQKVLDGSLIL